MTVLKLKFACLILLLHQLHGIPTSDDQDQLNYLKEKPIYDHNERAKFATWFNISSTAGWSLIGQVDINSDTGKMIEQYFENTNPHGFNVKISKIYSIQRKYEQNIFELCEGKGGFEDKGRLLLWHGTKMDLLQGILDNGLQAPEYQAQLAKGGSAFVMTMQTMFGSGIFFADRSSKSAQYTEREANTCQTNRLNAVKSGQQKVRGSNLGSWLVLEGWMAPGPWDQNGCNKDTQGGSYLLEKCLGGRASSVMQKHWSSFITENDFAEMSRFGVNVVRIPVGWWQIYDPQGGASKAKLNQYITPTDYITGGLAYLDKAFEWGKKYGIGILVGLHAAPGSQNGNDHSSPVEHPGQNNWGKYRANVAQTVDSIGLYAERYGKHPALFGFGLLNEPAQTNIATLQDYYKRAYARVRQHSPDSHIVINPLINPFESGTESYWTGFMNPAQGFTKVAMDLHYYSCFGGGGDQTNPYGAINYIRYDRKAQVSEYASKNPKQMLIGEWSVYGHFSNARAGDFTRAQVEVYNQASLGWTFWSSTNGAPGNIWSLKTAFNSGWLDKQYPC